MSDRDRSSRDPLDWLGRAAWTLLLVAIGLQLAWGLIQPLLPVIGVGLLVLAGWRVWWLRRW